MLLSYALTLFVSAGLLFLIQPMIGRMILPVLGGAPAVWNTCMVFFQAMLLAGYGYAHLTTLALGARRQAVLQLAVILLPLLVLPVVMGTESGPPVSANPAFWLLGRLAVAVGLPFFVVSTTSPLLQKWFAGTGHSAADDPYFLYAASNAGSLLALMGYPLLLEPALPLGQQSMAWAVGYVLLVTLIVLCAVLLWCSRGAQAARHSAPSTASHSDAGWACEPDRGCSGPDGRGWLLQGSSSLTTRRRIWWVMTALIPSSLMLGVTTHITTNLAPVPLLWVLPLALYLLTFVIVFSRRPLLPDTFLVRLLPWLVMPTGLLLFLQMRKVSWLAIVLHLVTFFVASLVCHRALARSRPATRHLTEFYLWMSLGGVLGGLFNAIVAPMVFDTVLEYPLALVAACMLLTRTGALNNGYRACWSDVVVPAALGAGFLAVAACVRIGGWGDSSSAWVVLLGGVIAVVLLQTERPIRFALAYGVFLLATGRQVSVSRGTDLLVERDFFGVKRVVVDAEEDYRRLFHGSTLHGAQAVAAGGRPEPLAYYHRTGPIGDCFTVLEDVNPDARVAVIGLGVGAVAAYAKPGQEFTFYEIDPAVERIARDPRYFTFLSQCKASYKVVIGDGRIAVGRAPDGYFDMIVLDAFSSDAIPTHLLTREAVQLYLSKLAARGVIVFHISNRYLDLTQLVGALAADADLACAYRDDRKLTTEELAAEKRPSVYAVVARRQVDLAQVMEMPGWRLLRPRHGTPVWTDQYSSVLGLFR
ncbi:MAG: spermidine synthase [Phycisphaerae bacterium]